ncbi:L-type lectin-domain containing receptor kinase IV.2 [Cocos nucifera]|uniref:non-specific serine/threonine protein kinase n=1 Tax=Cocos nucifera TaxID=13894 RepID=A0A8K0I7K9_COCNU|nr:L-type lectin-domain containing receptor kinase IV.2 [Cocos nucifera]
MFVFALVPEYPSMGGCGFTFALCPTTNFSGAFANQFFGLFNVKNNGKSSNHILAVEFDTAQNPDLKDINDNHVGIDINSLISNESHTAGYVSDDRNLDFKNLTLISGEPIQAWIEYDGIKMQLNVTLAPLNMSKPNLPLLSCTVNLSSIILDSIYVGFSSATSNIMSAHYILGWSFKMNGKAPALNLSSLPSLPPRTQSAGHKKQKHLTLWLPLAVSTVILTSFAAITLYTKRKNKFAELLEDWELDFGPQRFLYKDLFKATKGFKDKHLLGVGGFGQVYRGVLPNSKIEVAVKRVNHESREVREFITEMASIGQLRHRNLVQHLGYCRRKDELLLVYDYMPNGSLDKFLFEQPKSMLNWSQRFRIIKGVASGLLYLHEDCEKVVIHRDIKASNVLLDSEFNGRLGDFGLARLYDHGTDPKTTHVVGTMGYIAPEVSRTSKATTRSDVFAFGAFVLEVACGRRPIEPSKQAGEQILVDWVFKNWRRGAILEASDPRFRGNYVVEEMELVLKLGLLCSHPMPAARPSMRQVTQFLEGNVPLPELSHIDAIAGSLVLIQSEESPNYNAMLYPSLVTVELVQSMDE